jgi:hypothetical protein
MRIEQSTVALASQRQASTLDSTRASLEAWVGNRPSSAANSTAVSAPGSTGMPTIARISAQALAAARAAQQAVAATSSVKSAARQMLTSGASIAGNGAAAPAEPDASDPTISDPNLSVLVLLIERLTGHKIHLIHPGDMTANADPRAAAAGQQAAQAVAQSGTGSTPSAAQSAGWGVALHVEQVHRETETTAYTATGTVQTTDGQTVSFDFQLAMHRDRTDKTTLDALAGDAAQKVDPIALNLTGGPVSLDPARTAFDINNDGTAEQIAMPSAGTYFLALDRNGNGAIDGGGDLFGPLSGDGFAELQALDDDHNGWIDEGDTAFARLQLWSGPNASTTSLSAAGVGALYVGANVGTQFDLQSGSGESLGQVVSSSIYLSESGAPGALQQVDLTA